LKISEKLIQKSLQLAMCLMKVEVLLFAFLLDSDFHVVMVMGFIDEFVADFTALALFLKNKNPFFLLFLSFFNSCLGRTSSL